MSETQGIIDYIQFVTQKYGHLNLDWKMHHYKKGIAVASRYLCDSELKSINEIELERYTISTCNSTVLNGIHNNTIFIECIHDGLIHIPISAIRDVISDKPNYMKNSYQDMGIIV